MLSQTSRLANPELVVISVKNDTAPLGTPRTFKTPFTPKSNVLVPEVLKHAGCVRIRVFKPSGHVGFNVGGMVGDVVGRVVGLVVGRSVGLLVTGFSVGESVGGSVGEDVGLGVGSRV